ncbi:multidrug resistance-associated protein 1-like isoform X7 [Bacillus rossius redtenbacheri]|uniref:multidrug resistance-associated protein 1-like isoform X7 n=1 Tax=Bacillus rossius redtenbacheri TaxID=93214 RepID=UPI002FDE0549
MYTPLLNSYCGTKFWDANLTWYTEDPDLTPCFQKTVLVWVPCAFLWLFSPLETYYILHSKTRNVPWNWLNVSKLASSGALVLLSLVELGFAAKRNSEGLETYPVDIYSPLVMLVTLALSVVFVVLNRRNGLSTSGLLFLFWFLLSLCGVPQFRSELRALRDSANPELDRESVVYVIYYPLVLATLLLNCFGDSAPTVSEYVSVKNPCPEQNASFLSKLFFSWFDRLAWRGFRKPLEMKDLWNMNPQDTAREIVPVFDKHWEATRRKYDKGSASGASFQKRNDSLEFVSGQRAKKSQVSILPAIFKTFGPMFLFGSMLKLGQDLLVFVSPQILRLLISFVEGDEPLWKGYLYAVLILVTSVAQTLLLAQYFNRMFVVGMRIRTALISAIYRKALKMSNSARKESTVGEIVNLMSVDAQRFMDITTNLSMVWSAPLQITLAIIFLWDVLGPSVLAGLAVMIILIPVNGYIANKSKTLQIRQMKNKDERVKLMNEVLSGIKVLKLYAWEPSFEEQVLRIRGKEMKVLKQAAYLNAGTSFIWTCAPFLVCAVTFTVFVAVDENNILDAQTAFVSLSLFNILRFAFVLMPVVTVNLIEAGVSVKRMNAFINTEDLDSQSVAHESTEKQPIVVENGSFAWGKEEPPVLRNISLAVSQGSLVAVVGTVGSGKSSLVSALLGEMDKLTGRVNTKGSVAYVQQQAWIQNASLRDNITFGRPLDQTLYSRVVEACALKPDLEMLPAGDQTEIGEKGINLSGGQKQRVSLARAVYSNADLYLMDDPLSAVDSHVGKHIFENVIGPAGMLCKKTRILVTHGITFLPEVDLIVVLKDGEVSEHGNYRQLLERNGSFAEFLRQHVGQGTTSEADLAYLRQMSVDSVGAEGLDCLSQVISETLDSDDSKQGNAISGSLLRQQSRESSRSIVLNGSGKQLTPSEKDKPLLAGEKLIEVEKAETGSVNLEVYTYYLRSVGLVFAVATLLCNAVYQSFAVGANLWLSVWSNSAYRNDVSPLNVSGNFTAEGNDDQTMYLAVYGALGLGQGGCDIAGDQLFHSNIYCCNYPCWHCLLSDSKILCSNIQTAEATGIHYPLSYILSFWREYYRCHDHPSILCTREIHSGVRGEGRREPDVLLPRAYCQQVVGSETGDDRQPHHLLLGPVRHPGTGHHEPRSGGSLRQLRSTDHPDAQLACTNDVRCGDEHCCSGEDQGICRAQAGSTLGKPSHYRAREVAIGWQSGVQGLQGSLPRRSGLGAQRNHFHRPRRREGGHRGKNRGGQVVAHAGTVPHHRGRRGQDPHRWSGHLAAGSAHASLAPHHHSSGPRAVLGNPAPEPGPLREAVGRGRVDSSGACPPPSVREGPAGGAGPRGV